MILFDNFLLLKKNETIKYNKNVKQIIYSIDDYVIIYQKNIDKLKLK